MKLFSGLTFCPSGPSGPYKMRIETKGFHVRWNNIISTANMLTAERLARFAVYTRAHTLQAELNPKQSLVLFLNKKENQLTLWLLFIEPHHKHVCLMRPWITITFYGFIFHVDLVLATVKTYLAVYRKTHREVHYLNGPIVGKPHKANKRRHIHDWDLTQW